MVRVGLITCPGRRVATRIAEMLVRERLAACVNVVPLVVSIYRWNGKIRRDSETLLIVKTRAARVRQLERRVCREHPYTVPEIIFLPVRSGNRPYLAWLASETRPERRR